MRRDDSMLFNEKTKNFPPHTRSSFPPFFSPSFFKAKKKTQPKNSNLRIWITIKFHFFPARESERERALILLLSTDTHACLTFDPLFHSTSRPREGTERTERESLLVEPSIKRLPRGANGSHRTLEEIPGGSAALILYSLFLCSRPRFVTETF